jgi:hypothetical protein
MRWSEPLSKQFVSPKGQLIKTLADARAFLLTLPKSRHAEDDVQAAIEAVLMAAEGRGPVLHATAGVGRVLNGHSGIQLPNRPGGPDGKRHNR